MDTKSTFSDAPLVPKKRTLSPTIRQMVTGDIPDILKIEQASFPDPYPEDVFSNWVGGEGDGEALVADIGGKPVGYLLHRPDFDKPQFRYGQSLAVHPDYRNGGVGRALMDSFLSQYPRASADVATNNEASKALVKSLGFGAVKTFRTNAGRSHRMEKSALSAAKLVAAGKQTETDLTAAQKESGRYRKGRVSWKGLRIAIETPRGTYRTGKGWKTLMRDHYGFFMGSEGRDGDEIDVFINEDNLDSELLFVVHQKKPDGTFDEHKVIVGTTNRADAESTYLRNYSKGWNGMGAVVPVHIDAFKWWLDHADTSKPLREGFVEKTANVNSAIENYPQMLLVKRAANEEDAPFTVAVDLDGTLAEKETPFNPESIGSPRRENIEYVRKFADAGARIIIHTVRGDTELVADWCEEHDVPFDFINENPDQPPASSGKVFADVYWDDRAFNAKDPHEHGPEILQMITGESDLPKAQRILVHKSITVIGGPELLQAMTERQK